MAEVTLTATMDESHVLHLRVPPEIRVGEVEVVVRERSSLDNGPAILKALRDTPPARDPSLWQRAREELEAMRNED